MKGIANLVMLYIIFSGAATVVNIACQAIIVLIYHGAHAVPLSILLGTGAGLPVKYFLEKRHIFGYVADNLAHDGQIFFWYSLMGIFTTVLFWLIEYAFYIIFDTDVMRYIGGIIGLSLGYAIKYRLDKRFVFVKRNSSLKRGA